MDKQETTLHLSSLASGGSRIEVDGTMVLDAWEEWGSTFVSEPVTVGSGYHYLTYQYRSSESDDTAPTNSEAVFAWSNGGGLTVYGSSNHTEAGVETVELYADVGWLSCAPSLHTMQTSPLEAGFMEATSELMTTVDFAGSFTAAPMVFAVILSTDWLRGHLRLLAASEEQAAIATEYDTCNIVIGGGDHTISWIAMAVPSGATALLSAVSQLKTNVSDTAALLGIREALGLPDYLQWRNGSDPCGDRWAGIECRAAAGGDPRVVVLDVRVDPYVATASIDLTLIRCSLRRCIT
jgi:hypothetical protein